MPLVSCPNAGSRKTFKYHIERKCHLDGNRCMGIPQESTKHQKLIIKQGDVCLFSLQCWNKTWKQKYTKKTCKKWPRQTIFTCSVCSKQFSYKSQLDRDSETHIRVIFSCNKIIWKTTNVLLIVLNCQPWWI